MQSEQNGQLVTALRRAARELVSQRSLTDLEHTLDHIVASAVETVPGADAGGISMAEAGNITSRSPTNEEVRLLDELQARLVEGPCISAVQDPPEDGVVMAHDLATAPDADRWPNFAPRAVDYGYHSMMSTQLSVNGGTRAALNLYSHAPRAFDESCRTIAGLFGLQAGLLLYGSDHAARMSRALQTRDMIGQAKGILIERFRVDGEQAFAILVRSSQDTNIKLVEVARWLTMTGDDQPLTLGDKHRQPPG